MAVYTLTKKDTEGLVKLLKKASRVCAVHIDADVNTTIKAVIDGIITDLASAGNKEI